MVVIPQTDIFLLKSPLQIDNKNQLTFTDATAQFNYFSSLPKLELEDASYQRKDGVLRFNGNFEDIIQYNYCMYKNENYSNKWFYAFIVGMEYKNDNCTYIYLKTDVFQSWQFDLIYKQSYVDREMINVNEDIPGANLQPEDLETGEYKIQGTADIENLEAVYITAYSNQHILIKESVLGEDIDIDLNAAGGVNTHFINGIPTFVWYLCTTNQNGFEKLQRALETNNQSEYVIANFTVPAVAVNGNKNILSTEGYQISNVYVLGGAATPTIQNLISTPSQIDGYTPKNQKLRQYPFLYVGFNPTHGSEKVFRYEDFTNGTPSYKIISEVNPNPTVNIIPQNYRGQSGDSLCDLCSLNGYPQLGSKIDVYNSWIAENSGIINVETAKREQFAKLDTIGNTVGLFGSLGGMLGTAASGGGTQTAGGVGSLTGAAIKMEKDALNYDYYIQDLQKQVERQQILPDQVSLGGSNATLLGYNYMDNNIFTRYNIKRQFAERIDKFFDMFGYRTNLLKIPNINNRPNWNYIKLAGANILGDIPEADLQEIKSLFNEGITLWHNAATFLDYSQNNR